MQLLKKLWHDPVWSKVISALLIGIATAVYAWRTIILVFLSSIWSFLVDRTPVPNWIIVIAALLLIAFLIALVLIGIAIRGKGDDGIEGYRTDVFVGLKWRWGYNVYDAISHLYPYCPTCDYQIIPVEVSGYPPRTRFSCDVCATTIQEVGEPFEVIKGKVERMIHREIRRKIEQANNGQTAITR